MCGEGLGIASTPSHHLSEAYKIEGESPAQDHTD